jgi:formate dehydrogenase major subunit/formate dehydrogenase alpha subunit
MVVQTESPKLSRHRRSILELLLSKYHDSGIPGKKHPETEFMHWVRKYRVSIKQHAAEQPRYPVDADPNPFIWVDFNKCILCMRCVRACAEVQGRFVWHQAFRGGETRIVAGGNTDLLSARCESCGACVAFCPTGALENKLSIHSGIPDRKVTTTCTYCGVGCQLDLNIKDGRVMRVTSNPDAPVNGMALCVKGRYGYDFIHHPERLLHPRVRRYLLEQRARGDLQVTRQPASGDHAYTHPRMNSPWVEVDWDTALEITADKLRYARDTYGPSSVGVLTSAKCFNEENYLMNKFARQVIGTNSIDHCARL